MSSPLVQSVKEKIRHLAQKENASFFQLWQKLILERFLARVSLSTYREHFVLKGGALLAKYIPLNRETKDLDFLIQELSNRKEDLEEIIRSICDMHLQDSFVFRVESIKPLDHVHMPYPGAQIALSAKFGNTRTPVRIDLGIGDIVQEVDLSIDMTKTGKGPLFEDQISMRCYPIEFILAEKLETVVFRGEKNSRMKDFHDIYSIVSSSKLHPKSAETAIKTVFIHRNTSLAKLPLKFPSSGLDQLEKTWSLYYRRLKMPEHATLPLSIKELVGVFNHWLSKHTQLN